jgi:3-keto-disaccharide hydrolase
MREVAVEGRKSKVPMINSRSTVALIFSLLAATSVTAADEPWRNLPLIENGKVAADWQHAGWGKMVVEGDAIRTEPDERGLGLLVNTKEKLGNCQIRIVYRPQNVRSNAGVHIRMDDGILKWVGKESIAVKRDTKGKLPPDQIAKMKEASEKEEGAWYAVHHGYEVQIMDSADAFHRTGSIYSYASAAELPDAPAGQWRTMIITLQGGLVLVELDGKQITRFDSEASDLPPRKNWPEPKREYKRPAIGYIGLQTHDPGDIVYFREVSVRPLEKP